MTAANEGADDEIERALEVGVGADLAALDASLEAVADDAPSRQDHPFGGRAR